MFVSFEPHPLDKEEFSSQISCNCFCPLERTYLVLVVVSIEARKTLEQQTEKVGDNVIEQVGAI